MVNVVAETAGTYACAVSADEPVTLVVAGGRMRLWLTTTESCPLWMMAEPVPRARLPSIDTLVRVRVDIPRILDAWQLDARKLAILTLVDVEKSPGVATPAAPLRVSDTVTLASCRSSLAVTKMASLVFEAPKP